MKQTICIDGHERQICTRCIYDETVSGIVFDEEGVCNYCHTADEMKAQYHTGEKEGREEFDRILKQIKKDGAGKEYDCIIGVSGGTDSSYLIAKAVEWGLRPLAVHYDNTWDTAIATENIKRVLSKLNVDLYTYVVNNKESDDIFLSFLKASVPDLDASTDLAMVEIMYRAAAKYKVKYIIEGHSYITEGISPLSNMYMDGKYIQSIHKQYGQVPMETYPLMTFTRFMKWTLFKQIKRIRPFWYIDYSKEEARKYLQDNFNWEYYGGHHLENRIVAFQHSYYDLYKFKMDNRNLSLAAGVRSGLLNREEAIQEYFYEKPFMEKGLVEYVLNRFNLKQEELDELMNRPNKRYTDYKTYKPVFRFFKPLYFVMVKLNLVPMSFYIKFTAKD